MNIYYPTKDEFVAEMTSLSVQRQSLLFPDGIMDVYRKPLKLMASNMEKVFSMGTVFWTPDGKHCGPMLSCVNAIPCQAGVRLTHFLYGKGDDYIQPHVLSALRIFKDKMPNYIGNLEFLLLYLTDLNINSNYVFADSIAWKPGTVSKFTQRVAIKINVQVQKQAW